MTNAIHSEWHRIGQRIYKIIVVFNQIIAFLGAAALASLPVMIGYDVAARYFFLSPTIWAMELSTYVLQFIVFLPLGLLVTDDSHIRVTLLTDVLPNKMRLILRRISLVAISIFAGFVTWWGWLFTGHAWVQSQVSPTLLAVPLWLPYALIPLGGILLLTSALGTLLGGPIERPTHNTARLESEIT